MVLIGLTDRGAQLATQIPVSSIEIFAGALRSLSRSERAQLLTLLTKLSTQVRRQVGQLDQKPPK